ncbi:DUF4349 domain-containing protein [Subtercola boreus]|uniref:DUF4349 domain-containing protein n=1 Tax=Subtercola boreus TaxID=120213 RepID=A0A3E0WAN8_9MICO|nr:DUF4349 domain-containing protein [Subtercola boreus]RFA19880.1 hypothetical protein B7R24_11240 [Subtercola boreus]RFA19947.1 hypothetical protein B7R23_11220 [Subtercola boreus]RFA26340.1 hypothetical protein B7R25_11340 [Subtercola boreus]
MKRKLLVIAVAMSVLAVSGCSAFGGESSSSSNSGSNSDSGGSSSEITPNGAGSASAPNQAAGGKTAAVPNAQIVTTGTISLLSTDPIGVADKAVTLVEAVGGHVDSRTEQAGDSGSTVEQGGNARADLVLRVPSDKVSQAIDNLKQLATVDSVAITATDITTQVSDVNARITALQTSVARLLDLMSKATTTADLISLESTLSERQADLDGLTAQRDAYTDQVQYSSLSVSIEDLSTAPTSAPGDFWSGLSTGWTSLVAVLAGALVAFGVALPWLVVLAILAAIAIAVVRWATRGTRVAGGGSAGSNSTPAGGGLS